MRIFVLGDASRSGVKEAAHQLMPLLQKHAEIVLVDLYREKDLRTCQADLALVLGGDGAILRAARQMGYCQVPVLGINLGKLGFLADLSPDELTDCLPHVVNQEYRVVEHLMFECLLEPPADTEAAASKPILGLNEVVIQAGQPFHMIDLELQIDGESVTRFRGDGLIIGTPVGSTGHNLSAGGPILQQGLSAFVISSICPHSLTARPIVDSADKTYTIEVFRACAGTAVIIDGQELHAVRVGHRITVRKAPVSFGLVKVPGKSYYQTLRDKLRWGTLPNYRREP
ncbi:MAG: NAD(+)/NADH kinase [Gemmataceae bacterium]